MLLTIDIGNTNITFGIFKQKKLIRVFNIPTRLYSRKLLRVGLGKLKLENAILCSVVPEAGKRVEKDLLKFLPNKPYIIGKNISVPIKNLYRNPKQVGQDRLVNAYAAAKLYGTPLIAIDFGTAITFDVISKRKEYLGGMILPGLRISLEALNERTALLPKIALDKPKEFIGKDTKSSMLSGIVYGFGSLTDELVTKIRRSIGNRAKVTGTGGDIKLIARYCKKLDFIDANLTLKGLKLLFDEKENT